MSHRVALSVAWIVGVSIAIVLLGILFGYEVTEGTREITAGAIGALAGGLVAWLTTGRSSR
jgi:hypothetical protein